MRILLMIIMTVWCLGGFSKDITHVVMKNNCYVLYENSNIIKSISVTNGRFVGHTSKYIVLSNNGYYVFYNSDGKHMFSLLTSNIGPICTMTDNFFIYKRNGYMMKFDVKTKKSYII